MVEPLRPEESGMVLRDSVTNPWQVTEVTLLSDDGLGVGEVAARVAERLPYAPRFRRRARFAATGDGWVDDPEFEVGRHVRRLPVPERASLADVQADVAELSHAPLTRDHPRWEIGVVPSLKARRSALVTRINPAWVDGVGAVHLLQELFDDAENPDAPVPADWLPEADTEATEELTQTLAAALRDPGAVLGRLGGLVGRLAQQGQAALTPPARPRRLFVGGTGVPVAALERIAIHHGCTTTDVLLSLVAGGLNRRGERADSVALVPGPGQADAVDSALGVALEPVTMALPVRAGTALERLEQMSTLTRVRAESGRALPTGVVAELPGWAPATLHAMAARLSPVALPHEVLVSVVAGPEAPRFLGTRSIRASYPVITPTGAQRLCVGVTTYAGQAWFGLCGTEPVTELAAGIVAELGDLLDPIEES